MNKKRILIFSYNLDTGGTEKALITLLKNINYKKYDIHLFLEENKGIFKKEVPKKVNVYEYKVYKHKIKLIQKFKNFCNQLKFIMKNYHKYDCAINYSTYSYAGNFAVQKASKNRIIFVHNDYTNIYEDEAEFRNFFTTRNIYDYNSIVFVSNESMNKFLKFYPTLSNKTTVINNLINYDEIKQLSNQKIDIKFPRNEIRLLFVGRLEEKSKRISIQLKLINDLKKKYPNIKLYIVGDGLDKTAYECYVQDNNLQENVIFLGEQKNPYPYIKKCDYLLITSKYEGFPLVLNEAIVLKTGIISTLNFSDDIFNIGENYGFIVSKEYNQMKKEIEKIIDGKKLKTKNFDFEKINKERLLKLEDLINRGNK